MIGDTNAIIRAYLADSTACPNIYATVGTRIYCPRLPEKAVLPALAFFTRGGSANPHIPGMPSPSIQYDCWGNSMIDARGVYRALYNDFQSIQNISVTVGVITYYIKSVIEEVQGQDMQDMDYPNYHRVIAFFSVMIQAIVD